MGVVEQSTRAELETLDVTLGSSVLGAAALDLARRIDADPGDRAATMLSRELRLTMAELHRHAGKDVNTELEAFLGRISNPTFRGPGD